MHCLFVLSHRRTHTFALVNADCIETTIKNIFQIFIALSQKSTLYFMFENFKFSVFVLVYITSTDRHKVA